MEKLFKILISLILIFGCAFGTTTGKVAGYITDQTTGEPLFGANIVIKNTHLGAASDMSGYYVILNVPPGSYEMEAYMIGYAQIKITDVVVNINLTTNIDIQMATEVLVGSEVTVIADRPIVEEEISHSQLNIAAETIETMPVTDVTDVIGLQAGVEGLSIRGGSASETSFIVDGFVMKDARNNAPYSVVSLSSVKEVTVQTGGFNAEYANVRSGAINVITEDGRPDKYGASFSLVYQPPTPKHYGISPYDPDSYFLRPYMDPVVCWTGTWNGEPYEDRNNNGKWDNGEPFADYNNDGELSVWDAHTQQQYPSFEGWNAISRRTLEDSNPDNDLTPEAAKKLFEWQHRRQGDIKKPDYTLDLNFGGPVPVVSKALGNLRFNMAIRDVQDIFIFPLSRDAYRENQARIKLTSDLNDDTKLTVHFLYGEENSTTLYNWRPTPTGAVVRSDYTIANLISGEALFVPAYYSPTSIYRNVLGLKISRVISSHTFYEISLQNKRDRYYSYQVDDRDSTLYAPIPGYPYYLVDEAPYGYYGDEGINSIGDNLRIGGWMNLGRDRSIISATIARFDFTSQINSNNLIRFGVNAELNNLNIKSYTSNPGMSTWNREQVYNVKPYLLGAYIYDKMEFKGLIANLSLRADLSNANTDNYLLNSFDSFFKAGAGYLIEEESEKEKSQAHLVLSPRIGISHPISVNSKLYFNYGHYRSEPSSTSRFRIQREYNGQVTDIGNPNLLMEKTVSYELGYTHNLFNRYLLNLAAYYKNIDNQLAWVSYENINSSIKYVKPENNNYEDIRGFEVTIDKQRGDWLTGFINYTYMVNTSGYFDLLYYYENPTQQREYINTTTTQSRPVPRPYIRANFDLHTPDRFGPKLFGEFYLLGGINVNLLATWKAGSYTTYNPTGAPGVSNNVQWKDRYNLNMRITKDFRFDKISMLWYVDFTNLLDTKFLSYAGFANSQDYAAYMGSLHFDWEEGIEYGHDRIGEYRAEGVDYTPMRSININPLDLQKLGVDYTDDGSGAIYFYEGARIISVIDNGDGNFTPVFHESQTVKQYISWDEENGEWYEVSKSRVNQLLEDKAYIDMPNIQSMTFLNPRTIRFGIQITF